MLIVREIHQVIGQHAHTFESTYRNEWVPSLGLDDSARLLWYANHAHLTCFAYYVMTITAVRDGAAWEQLADRIHRGDLRETTRTLDGLRHDVRAQILRPAAWSPLLDLDLAKVPVTVAEHESALFVGETFRTREPIDEAHAQALEQNIDRGIGDEPLTETVGCFIGAYPEGPGDDVMLWQRVRRPDRMLTALTTPASASPAHGDAEVAGTDRVDSTMQRVSRWSPLF